MREEREGVGDGDGHDGRVAAHARRDGRAQQRQEQHEEEGDELAYGVQDAEHHEVGQEAGVLESGGNSAIFLRPSLYHKPLILDRKVW